MSSSAERTSSKAFSRILQQSNIVALVAPLLKQVIASLMSFSIFIIDLGEDV
jgi:uncharacterized membrane protein